VNDERLGIFGGTFDPPHIGHLILAEEARAQLNLSRVLWVLTAGPPHKEGHSITPLSYRIEMVMGAIRDDPCFELSRVDIDRPAPHYSADTMRIVADAHPHKELVYLMGGDSLRDILRWHEPLMFVDRCDAIGVMHRPGGRIDLAEIERSIPGISNKINFIEALRLEISSSEIRLRIREGRPFRYYLPKTVFEYITLHKLYR
jgi:nicotinate-nucleotide adenylyltransferase